MAGPPRVHGQATWKKELLDIRIRLGLNQVQVEKGFTGHAWDRGVERNITIADTVRGLKNTKAYIIAGEEAGSRLDPWGKPYPYPTRIIATWTSDGVPICVVLAVSLPKVVLVVTVYLGEHGPPPAN